MSSTTVYNQLKRWIYRGRLQPGQRLVETDLAREVGTSRIPLRESLHRLESEGLVKRIPNTATYVETLSPSDMREIFFMRLLLEPPATRLATRHGTPRLFRYLRRLAAAMGEARRRNDKVTLDRLDYRFHHAIVKGSRCRRLLRAYESCHIQIVGPRIEYANLRSETGELTEQLHNHFVDLMEGGQAEQAESFSAQTLQEAIQRLDEYFESLENDE